MGVGLTAFSGPGFGSGAFSGAGLEVAVGSAACWAAAPSTPESIKALSSSSEPEEQFSIKTDNKNIKIAGKKFLDTIFMFDTKVPKCSILSKSNLASS